MKRRILSLLLLLALCLSALVACDSASEATTTAATDAAETPTEAPTEAVTEAPVSKLTVDAAWRIVIAAEADEMTQRTAALVADTLKEKAGLELTVVTDAEAVTAHELVLGATNRAESAAAEGEYAVYMAEDAIYLDASDTTVLYFAAEAVLNAWLTEDFGLSEAGSVTLAEDRVADLNGLTTRLANSVKIMTQNVRGDGNDGDGLSVVQRYERFVKMLTEYKPDVLGTQEYTFNYSYRLTKMFEAWKEGDEIPLYGIVDCSVEGAGKRAGGRNAILYRMDKYELVDSNTFWLSATPETPSVVEGCSTNHKRVCTWVLLKDKQTGQTFMVANTHLDHTSNTIRLKQVTILMEQLALLAGDYPVYLTGDFNCGRNSEPYSVPAATMFNSHETAWVDHSTVEGTFHGYRDYAFSEIDFVFHSERSTPVNYEIVSKKYDGFVSDHYGVIVQFVHE
jgi:endonuclease/exonuclease/phosphatase family metal-dependent hydrolase